MFDLTRYELDTFAKETGFLKNSLEKMYRLLNILSILKTNPVTKDAFVLKGGTAINLFPQKEIQEKVLNSPSLKWKIKNITKSR